MSKSAMWRFFSAVIALMLFLQLGILAVLPVSAIGAGTVVTFPDTNLEVAVREALSEPVGAVYAELLPLSLPVDETTGYTEANDHPSIINPQIASGLITANGDLSSAYARQLARTSDGAWHCVYSRHSGAYSQIYHSYSANGGESWTEEQLTNASYRHQSPTIAIDSKDYIHVAWDYRWGTGSNENCAIQYRVKTTTWQSIENIISSQSHPAIAIDSEDNIHLVVGGSWGEAWECHYLRYKKRTASGWGPTETVSSTCWSGGASIAIDQSNNIHVIYSHAPRPAPHYGIRYREKIPSGWKSEEIIETDDLHWGLGSMAIDSGGNVYVVYYNGVTGKIKAKKKTDSGWQTLEEVYPDSEYLQQRPEISIDSDDYLHVVWEGKHAGSPDHFQIRYRKYTTSWSSVQNLTSASVDQKYPYAMWAWWPLVGGLRTNRIEHGYAFIWNDGPTIRFHNHTDPSITTDNVSFIDNEAEDSLFATVNGTLTSMGDASSAQVSFDYWTPDNYTQILSTPILAKSNIGSFSDNLTNLSYDTTYIFRSKVTANGDTVYGNNLTFYAVPSWRADIEPGDILWAWPTTKTGALNSLVEKIILFKQEMKDKYYPNTYYYPVVYISHTGIFEKDGTVIESYKPPDWPLHDAGVYRTSIKIWDTFNKENVRRLRVYSDSPSTDSEYRSEAVEFAQDQIRWPIPKQYNIGAYFSGTKNFTRSSSNWYCSELVWASYWNEGNGINIENNLVNPDVPDGEKKSEFYTDPVLPHEFNPDPTTCPHVRLEGWHLIPGNMAVNNFFNIVLSPVDVEIFTPEGYVIKKGYSTLPGASYDEADFDGDGELEDIIIIPTQSFGNYRVNVIPHPGANSTDTYSLLFFDGVTSKGIMYAVNTTIGNIPQQGYTINWNGTNMQLVNPSIAITPDLTPAGPLNPLIRPPSSSGSVATPLPQAPVALSNIYVQSASLSASKVAPGTPVTVTANIANRGTVNGSTRIKIYVNGEEDSSKGVTVESGGNRPVYFTVNRNQPGTYDVYVGGVQAGTFMVENEIDPNIILLCSCTLILISLALGIVYILRRRNYDY